MSEFPALLQHPALWLVALNTLLHELGVPVPLTPTVLIAGAASVSGGDHPLALLAVIVAAMLAGNAVWFAAGRRYGSRVLKLLCRVSLSPDSCVRRTQDSFGRWGWSSIVVGRFIPGVSLVAPPLAGALGMSWSKFIALSMAGAALWGLAVVGAGMLLHAQVDAVIATLAAFARETLVGIGALFALYIVWRWWQRRAAARALDAPRISVGELKRLLDAGEAPLVVDIRGAAARTVDPRRIPDAIALEPGAVEAGPDQLPHDRRIVLYCDCPHEASAAHVAKLLIRRGHRRVQALLGGLEAWAAAGFEVETGPPAWASAHAAAVASTSSFQRGAGS